MNQDQWSAVDQYIANKIMPQDTVLEAALIRSQKAKLPPINVTPPQGKMLHLLAKIQGARSILEIGTLGAYSTIWLARALPADGHLVTLDCNPRYAEVARANLAEAGCTHMVDIRLGTALSSLAQLSLEKQVFDFIFIDADKENNAHYLDWAIQLSRRGTVIVCDNVVRGGRILDSQTTEPNLLGIQRFFDLIATDKRLSATAVQTVGSKGYDGFCLAVVL